MRILAFDTSGAYLNICLIDNDKVYFDYNEDCSLRHSVLLMPAIENILESNNLKLSDIDVFCSALGPGSFTGIRIGISTAKAFSYANNKEVLGVSTFDILLANRKGKILTVIDAKHDNYYICGYNDGKISLKPKFTNKDEVLSLASEYSIVSGDELEGFDFEKADIKNGLFIAINNNLGSITKDRETLIPLYIRKSQAEENK